MLIKAIPDTDLPDNATSSPETLTGIRLSGIV